MSTVRSGERTPLLSSQEDDVVLVPALRTQVDKSKGSSTGYLALPLSKPVGSSDPESGSTAGSKSNPCSRYWGIFYALIASVLLSLTTLLAKLLIGYHPFNVAIWRFQGILLPSLPVLVYCTCVKNEPVFESIRPVCRPDKLKTLLFLFLRAFFGCSAVIMQFYALQYIQIGDATVISFTTPVFVGILSHFLLGEAMGIVPVLTAILSIVGIGIITRPPIFTGSTTYDTNNLIGAGMALGCMVFATFTYVILRWLRHVHHGLITFCYGFFSILECSICAIAVGLLEFPITATDWVFAVTLALLAYGGQAFFTQALKHEEAGPVSLIRTCEVIFTFVWQMIFLNVIPDGYSIVGALTIILGVLVTTLRKWVKEMPEESEMHQRLSFLLK